MLRMMEVKVHVVSNLLVRLFMFCRFIHCYPLTDKQRCVSASVLLSFFLFQLLS